MDPAQRDGEFIAHFSAEPPRLHEAKMVGIAGFSPAYETGLLGDEAEMLLVAVATRLGNREGAFVDVFGLALGSSNSHFGNLSWRVRQIESARISAVFESGRS
jgi:hypothetical protein